MLNRLTRFWRDSSRMSREQKSSRVARLIQLEPGGTARWTPRDYAALAREGFVKNAVAHRAVKLVAENVAALTFLVYQDGEERDAHPLAALLKTPNPRQDGAALLEALTAHLLISGNGYLELVSLDGAPREIFALRPDRMRVVPGPDGWAQAYDYTVAGRTVRFEQAGAPPPVLHLVLFNPLDDHYGLGALEAAAVAVDIHNAAARWNKALLDNAARPSGALVYAGQDGAILAEDQYERLKRELESSYQGAANAGRPLLLEGGLDWKAMSLTPKDMDFLEAKNSAAREIALAFGVPPMLLGIPGDNTYANFQEANRAFWRHTVLPLGSRIGSALSQWLAPAFGEGVTLVVDTDRVDALSDDRAALWERVTAAPFLTVNEKRAMVGFGRIEGGDVV
ncbi:phage portal protein [Rhodoplanes roseus]|uniref:Phage portal protein n=1 Tax=Rhodoplanes roseus TaxID=29409 RepID=A0A327KPI3_9BRAD|nr:phage portal protein [Rhodoplanes roseus]RAI39894.1 phage portal protein [Rhodoplanes roseus]